MNEDLNTWSKLIIILILLYLIWIILHQCRRRNKKLERFDASNPVSNEAIQNISSIYNADLLKVSNIETTSSITSPLINSTNLTNETLTSNEIKNVNLTNENITTKNITSDIITGQNMITNDITINNNKAVLSNKQYKLDTGIYTGMNDTGNGTIKFNVPFTNPPNVFFTYQHNNADAVLHIYLRSVNNDSCSIKCVGSSGKGYKLSNVLWFAIGE